MTATGKSRFENSQWPIADYESRLTSRDKETLKHVTPKHRALIERTQPYNGGDFYFPFLRDLSNQDKHRLLVAAVSQSTFGLEILDLVAFRDCTPYGGTTNARTWLDAGALKAGTPFIRRSVTITGPNPRVHVNGRLPTHVALEEPMWRAVEVLRGIWTKICETVEEAAKDFPAGTPGT
jgi:hypothetical protein